MQTATLRITYTHATTQAGYEQHCISSLGSIVGKLDCGTKPSAGCKKPSAEQCFALNCIARDKCAFYTLQHHGAQHNEELE